jgi:hypothetical protein
VRVREGVHHGAHGARGVRLSEGARGGDACKQFAAAAEALHEIHVRVVFVCAKERHDVAVRRQARHHRRLALHGRHVLRTRQQRLGDDLDSGAARSGGGGGSGSGGCARRLTRHREGTAPELAAGDPVRIVRARKADVNRWRRRRQR